MSKKYGTNLGDLALAGGVAKMPRVPIEAPVVEGGEVERLLDAVGQIDVALEHVMQPGGAGARRTDSDKLRQPVLHILTHPSAAFGVRRSRSPAARGFFHAGEIDREQFFERLDFGQVALAQAFVLLRRETRIRLAAALAEFPHAGALQREAHAIRLMAVEPVDHGGRAAGELAIFRRAREGVYVAAKIGTGRERDSRDADEVADAIEIRLRLRAQLIIYRDQYVLAAKALEPRLELRGVAVGAAEIWRRFDCLLERSAAQPAVVTLEFVHGIHSIDRIAHGRDDLAIRNLQS